MTPSAIDDRAPRSGACRRSAELVDLHRISTTPARHPQTRVLILGRRCPLPSPSLAAHDPGRGGRAPIARRRGHPAPQRGLRGDDRRRRPVGRRAVRRLHPDLVVLDLMLPGLDGLDVCREIQRDRPVPVLMLTARDSETDLVVGLDVGADDYLTKPFSARELVARVHALLRRVERRPARPDGDAAARPDHASSPPLATGAQRRRARAPHAHRVRPARVPRASDPRGSSPASSCSTQVWGYHDGAGARTVDSHVRALRRKLGNDVVRTVHGVGYARRRSRRVNRRDRLAHPLDDVPSIKLKLGFVIAAAVAVTVFVFWVGLKIGLWPSVERRPRRARSRWSMVWFLSRGMTSPLREMAAAASEMAKGNYDRRVRSVVARRGRRARPGVQPDGGRARRDRPCAARPRRQRVARAAHADHRAAGGPREPGRRRQPSPTPRPSAPCSRRSSGSAAWSSSSSTCPGSSRARCRSSAPSSGSSRCSRTRCASSTCTRPRSTVSVVGRLARPHRRRRSRACAPGRRQPARERGAAHAARRDRRGARASHAPTASPSRCVDEGPGIPEAEQARDLRALLPRRRRARVERRRRRPRPRHRAMDRRPPRRRHPSRTAGAARLPHGRHPSRTTSPRRPDATVHASTKH